MTKNKTNPARRFEAKKNTIMVDLKRTMAKLGAATFKVRLEEKIEADDRPLAEIFFILPDGRECFSRCAAWTNSLDNLRAAQLAIEYAWRIAESYGVQMMSQQAATDFVYSLFWALEPVTRAATPLLPAAAGEVVDAEVIEP